MAQQHYAARQPQHPPPQQPPADGPAERAGVPIGARPPIATVDSNFTVSVCPSGQVADVSVAVNDRLTSKVAPHWRQR